MNDAKTGREDGGRVNSDGEPDLVSLDDALTTVGQGQQGKASGHVGQALNSIYPADEVW